MWEDRKLRGGITEADLRQLVAAGYEEGLQLDYKQALYEERERGHKEFLQDVCMFANGQGGLLLIGIPEARDAEGQPTGAPDPNAQLGIEVANPEQLLLSYDARVVSNVEERLQLESAPIAVAEARYVLAIRIPNSLSKPHCVRYQGQVYFPSRRERHRYHMDVREIKELVMRTASRLEAAEEKLTSAFREFQRQNDMPYLRLGCIPVFGQDFLLDVRKPEVIRAVSRFDLGYGNVIQPTYSFNGLERRINQTEDSTIQARRNGMIVLNKRLNATRNAGRGQDFRPVQIDLALRKFIESSSQVYTAASISGPFLVSMALSTATSTQSLYQSIIPNTEENGELVVLGDYPFPVMRADNLQDIDKIIRPLCDQAHQMFGRRSSPYFNGEGAWRGPRD